MNMNGAAFVQASGHTASQAATAAAGEHLSFRLGAEEYGLDILKVQEIRSYEAVTRIANAPPYIKGVLNLRGVIVPIVDLRLKLGLADAQYNALTVVIVMNVADRVIGIVVDSVSDVLALAPEQIKPAPKFGGLVDADFITGIGTARNGDQERMLILTDVDRLLMGADMGLVDAAMSVH
jgi:purine-binding chemotaxis protein CheW